jgi:hypothetical protein
MPNAECGMGRPGDKESASIAEPGRRRNGVGGQTHARRKLVPPGLVSMYASVQHLNVVVPLAGRLTL